MVAALALTPWNCGITLALMVGDLPWSGPGRSSQGGSSAEQSQSG